jgi:ABC-type multidrug transport system ATPase subunit
MITAENLTKRYGRHAVLDHLSFTIQSGESVALWGANGAGKTTTLRCLLGVLPFAGQLSVNGIDVKRNGKAARTAIGYVPQETLFYDLTVWQTLEFYARLKKVPQNRLESALARVGLLEQRRKSVKALSGGMKQRLALAVSLLSDPPLLLFDEPTANLDAQSRHDFLQLVQSLNQDGKTIVFSTHRVDEMLVLATRALLLENGKVVFDGAPLALTERLGLRQWLRISIPPSHWETAQGALQANGFIPIPNGRALYVQISERGKMAPLRTLEAAQVPVEDFDVVGESVVPQKEKP